MLRRLLDGLGLYRPLRAAFYRSFRAITPVKVAGLEARFHTPDPDTWRRVVKLGGEREQIERFLNSIQPGDTVWDIGAFIGMFTVLASRRVGPEGRVVSFEPEPSTWQRLQANCKLNQCENTSLFNAALADHSGEGMIYPSRENENAIHSLQHNEQLQDQGIPVRLYSATELIREHDVPFPDAIKLDVEGAECLVMRGMKDILSTPRCRFLFMEVHPRDLPGFGHSVEDVHRLLEETGFVIEHETRRGSEYHYFCRK